MILGIWCIKIMVSKLYHSKICHCFVTIHRVFIHDYYTVNSDSMHFNLTRNNLPRFVFVTWFNTICKKPILLNYAFISKIQSPLTLLVFHFASKEDNQVYKCKHKKGKYVYILFPSLCLLKM